MQPHSISLPLEQPNQSSKADLMNQQIFASDNLEREKASPLLEQGSNLHLLLLLLRSSVSSLGETKHLFKMFNFLFLGWPDQSWRVDLMCAVFWCPNIDLAARAQDFFPNTHIHMLIHMIVHRGLYGHVKILH